MGTSANDALCELLLERGLVQEDRLRHALQDAERDRVPLEQVLLRRRELGPAEAQAALMERRERGRNCRTCARVTYLMAEGSEHDTPCERCGGRLLPGVAQRLTRATLRKLRPVAADEPDPPPRRTRVSLRHAPRPTTAYAREAPRASAPTGSRVRDEVDRYLEQLQLVRRAVREAREAARAAVAEGDLGEELGARVLQIEGLLDREGIPGLKESLLTALREEVANSPGGISREEIERIALSAVKQRLSQPDVRPLITTMMDKAARALDEELEADGLRGITARVEARATEVVAQALEEARVGGLDARIAGLERQLDEQLTGLRDELQAREDPTAGVDLGLLQERVSVLESRPAAAPAAPTDLRPLERRLAEVEQRTPDALELEERVHALERRPASVGEAVAAEVDLEAVAQSVTDTLRGDLEDLRASAREDAVRQVEAQLPDLAQRARQGIQAAILEQVEHRLSERIDVAQHELLDVIRRERGAALAAFTPPAPAERPAPTASQATPRESRRSGHEVLLESLRGLLQALRRRLRPMLLVFALTATALLAGLSSLPVVHQAEAIVGPRGFGVYTGPARRLATLTTSQATLDQVAGRLAIPPGRRLSQVLAGWPADRAQRLGAKLEVTGEPGAVEHITITAQGETPEEATQGATLLAEALLAAERAQRGEGAEAGLEVLRPAEVRGRASLSSAWPGALLAALGLALISGLLLELRRPAYHDAEEAARDLSLPILTVVPHAGGSR